MPLAKLNTTAATTNQPPHRISAPRCASVRGSRRGNSRPANRHYIPPGRSHAMVGALPPPPRPPPADLEVQIAEAPGLVAGEPAETVVTQRQFDDAVLL